MTRMAPPSQRHTVRSLMVLGRALGVESAFQADGTFYFELGGPWLLGLRPDDANRFRLSACYGATEVGRVWATAGDYRRLAALAGGLQREIAAMAA
jgi:hypothetical protein